jgi:hypothetical protein
MTSESELTADGGVVIAGQALVVRDRVENALLDMRPLLVKFDNESYAASSIVTFTGSYYSVEAILHTGRLRTDAKAVQEAERKGRNSEQACPHAKLYLPNKGSYG